MSPTPSCRASTYPSCFRACRWYARCVVTSRRRGRHPGSASKAARCAGAAATDAGAEFGVGPGPPGPLGSRARSGAAPGLSRGGECHWILLGTSPVHRPQFPCLFSGSGSGVQELGPPVFRLGSVTQNRALPCLGLFPALQGWGVRVYASPAPTSGFC